MKGQKWHLLKVVTKVPKRSDYVMINKLKLRQFVIFHLNLILKYTEKC